jgi:predicted dehydrogenase
MVRIMKKQNQPVESQSRRGFLSAAAKTVAGGALAPAIVPASALGLGGKPPSDRVTLGIIGSGTRGVFEGQVYAKADTCQIVALCDAREDRRLSAQATFEKIYGLRKASGMYRGMQLYSDFRDLLRRKDIDAVYIATPDHWHVPITIAALKAGKDLHTEKPLAVSIEQNFAALKAVQRYHRICQYGAERRSTPDARHAVELVLNGRIGKVEKIYVISPPSISGGSPTPVLPVPKGFDYDMWLGPAPEAPFCYDRCLSTKTPKSIFQIYDYSLGFIANWAAHPLDQVQWWADNAGMTTPVSYAGSGQIAEGGLFDCAIRWDLNCRYENGLLMRFMDYETSKKYPEIPGVRDNTNAATFVGTDGWVSISYQKVLTNPASLKSSEIGPGEKHLVPSDSHQLSWIECVKTRKDPVDPIESGVRSNLVSLMSDICIRAGGPVRWDRVKQTVIGNEAAMRMMSRPMRKPWGLA